LACQLNALGACFSDLACFSVHLQGDLAQGGAVLVGLDYRTLCDLAVVGLVRVAREDGIDLGACAANELAISGVFGGNICALVAIGPIVGQQYQYISFAIGLIAIGELRGYTVSCL